MEAASFLASNPFPLINLRARTSLPFRKRQAINLVSPVVTCCNLESWPTHPEDEGQVERYADWRSFRAKLIAGQKISSIDQTLSSAPSDLDTAIDHTPPSVSLGEKWVHPIHEPEKGCLLVATEKLNGVHIFERTVILVLQTDPLGLMGIILNRPSLMSIKETRSTAVDLSGTFSDRPLYFGGLLEEGLFLLNPKGKDDEWIRRSAVFQEVMKGWYYGTKGSVGCASEMVKRNLVGLEDFRFFDGYCVWEKDQLKDEIRGGYWILAACSPSVIGLGSVGSVGLWEDVLGLLGPRKVW